jgi:hypothetical protein
MTRRLCSALLLVFLASGAPAASIDQSMRDVERIRGLKFLHPVRTVSIDRARLPSILHEQIEKSLPYSFDDYLLVLTSLRLVDPGAKNLEASMIGLMEQQVLAFYDPLTHVYYAIAGMPAGLPAGASALGLDDAVAVHELTHAIQDQHFGISKFDAESRDDSDLALALHSLVEGEASLVMLAKMVEPMGQTLDSLTSNDSIVNAIAGAATMMANTSADTPRYFTESLAIPYTAGLRFVIEAYRRGGWERVNRIYEDPPRSMREVLHPDEYFSGRRTSNPFPLRPPVPVRHLLTVEHLGEWHWQFLLGAAAARGWTGDRVTVAQDEFCNPTVLVETRWETPEGARAFRKAYLAFLQKQHLSAEARLSGNEVNVAYGADLALISQFLDGGIR